MLVPDYYVAVQLIALCDGFIWSINKDTYINFIERQPD